MSSQNAKLLKAQDHLNNALEELKQNNFKEAEKLAKRAQKIAPNSAAPINIMGLIYRQQNKLPQAEAQFQKSIKKEPNNIDTLRNLGTTLVLQNKSKQAIEFFEKALNLKPDLPDVSAILINQYTKTGAIDKANALINSLEKSTNMPPETYNVMGQNKLTQNDTKAAIGFFKKALDQDINYHQAWSNLSGAFYKDGNISEALKTGAAAITLSPDTHLYKVYFTTYCDGVTANNGFDQRLFDAVGICLSSPYIAKQTFFHIWRNLLKNAPIFQDFNKLLDIKTYDEHIAYIEEHLNKQSFIDAVTHPFLLLGLKEMLLIDNDLEHSLTLLRRFFLLANANGDINENLKPLLYALAMQSYNNEHVFYYDSKEETALEALKRKIENEALEDSLLCDALHIYGAYAPLMSLQNAKDLAEQAQNTQNPQLAEILMFQVADPLLERSLAASIPKHGTLEVKESSKNQKIYEENPYPRWKTTTILFEGASSDMNLDMIQNEINIPKNAENADILIAGCGTGQHAIHVALHAPQSKVLAIDYTLSSLAYAQRKTLELGIKNINYMQADILELNTLEQKFSHIECSGVIHHIKDDKKAIQILRDLLTDDGTLKIGVYSKTAREHNALVTQKHLQDEGYEPTEQGIRAARHHLQSLSANHPARNIASGKDFFALSTARFHIFDLDEKSYTPQDIQKIAAELGMKLVNFELNNEQSLIFNQLREENPNFDDYEIIESIEKQHPTIFAGMYNFTLQKNKSL